MEQNQTSNRCNRQIDGTESNFKFMEQNQTSNRCNRQIDGRESNFK